MKGVLEVFGISAIALSVFAIARYLWRRYIAKQKVNVHAQLEPVKVELLPNGDYGLEFYYRLALASDILIHTKIDGVSGDALLEKAHEPGYFKFKGILNKPGGENKICFKANNTYIERKIRKPQA